MNGPSNYQSFGFHSGPPYSTVYFARFDLDATWSETGDRYLLKLFRDYVFHQVDETGAPLIDMPHMIATLNKVFAVISVYQTVINGNY